MSESHLLEVVVAALSTAGFVAAPFLLSALVVGVLVSVFMAATQIQETTLSFVPKLAALGLVLIVLGPLLVDRLVGLTTTLIEEVGHIAPGAPP
ncbi:MAG: flagellar biosynthetic protein FliQ [Deltaproteobacteria bacterium]|nr:flagellar biosynthetic protein FliQ [Deltaproteobacteria bacterium]